MEEWKDVIGYEGIYKVSDRGNVYSCKSRKCLKKTLGKRGYLTVSLFHKGIRKEATVHRLVAMAFIPKLENFSHINHKDECKTNNHVSNLEWCSALYNNRYGTAIKRATESRQKKILQYARNGELLNEWASAKVASETLGINQSNICQCCKKNPRHPSAGGFVWKYASGGE